MGEEIKADITEQKISFRYHTVNMFIALCSSPQVYELPQCKMKFMTSIINYRKQEGG